MDRFDRDADAAGGRIRSRATNTEDLTRAIVDSEARQRAQTTLRDRLQDLLRNRGGRLLALVNEGGAFRVYQISRQGVQVTQTNWPRGLHEGNAFGTSTGIMVLVTSFGFVGLMVTGLTIYVRRRFRKPNRVRNRAPAANAA